MTARVVIKVGTSILTGSSGTLSSRRIQRVAEEVASARQAGRQVVLVSSGAVGAGMSLLGFAQRPKQLPHLQAAAAVGQHHLMQCYERALKRHHIIPAQILLTQSGMHDRKRYLNARNTILELLSRGVLPIINENDTVATEEIQFGDNDRLSAVVASLIQAHLLIILSNVEGYLDVSGRVIPRISRFTRSVREAATSMAGTSSVGGMAAKLDAAEMATRSGIPCVIASGLRSGVVGDILSGQSVGTYCEPQEVGLDSRKRWMAFAVKPRGRLVVDDGAKQALLQAGKSLLASGIVSSSGRYAVGDPVAIEDLTRRVFARGLVNYDSKDVEKICGLKTSQIAGALGAKTYDEVIHRNNLVVLS